MQQCRQWSGLHDYDSGRSAEWDGSTSPARDDWQSRRSFCEEGRRFISISSQSSDPELGGRLA
ncbi:hypothetical protein FVA81_03705 (plasmid) [Rhizobium sp. WL3]|nr:hypothetical protein FVA81_03705 [Rhizobium sp. WL3]